MLNKKNLFQGRSMVEILGVLAIIGILSVGGVLGYRYAMNLHKANQIIYDVSMGMKLVSTSKKTGGFSLDFEPTSPYTYTGFKMIYPERRLGFVVTHNIEVPVCEILLGKQSDTSFYIYQADENAGTFQLMDGCVANQAYYFASVNTSDAIACNCGNHAHCTDLLTGNCECDSGYTMNANGKCISDSCDDASASGPGAVQDEECCVDSYGWLWLDDECYCPFPTTWDSGEKDCVGACPSTVTALSQLTRKACCEKKHYTWNAALRHCDCPENYVWNDFVKGCVDSSMRPDRPEDATDEETCKMWGWYWDAKTSKCTCPLGEEWDSATSACVVCDMLSPPSYPEDVTAKVCCEKWNFEWNVADGLCGCPSLYTWNNTTKQCENLCGMPEQPEDVATQECCESFEWEWRDNACHCPESAPNYSVSGGVGLCCPAGQENDGGVCAFACYLTNNSNAPQNDTNGCQSNQNCCSSDDFCAFLNSDVANNTKGPGTCVPVTSYQSKAVVVSDKIFIRSDGEASEGMNWWSAQNWCLAKNVAPATRASIGCGTVGNGVSCNSEYTNSWASNTRWMGSNVYRKVWLEEATGTNPSAGWTIRLSKDVQNTTDGDYHNKLARSDDRFAMCVTSAPSCSTGSHFDIDTLSCVSCDANPGDPADVNIQVCCEYYGYTWNAGVCTCPSGQMWDETEGACVEMCYTTNNANAPEDDQIGCGKNADCCSSNDFCAFLNSDVNTNTKGPGTCVPINTYKPQSVIVDDAMFVRSDGVPSAGMNWWSAQNWCMAKGLDPATRDNIGCGSINKDKTTCNSKYTNWASNAIWMGDNPDRKLWLDDSGSVGWTVRLSKIVNNTSTGQYHNKLSRSDDRFALCRGEPPQCDPTQPDDPATITSQECCEYYKNDNNESIWAWDSVNNTCGCPSGSTWFSEEKKCFPDDMCVYYFERPEAPTTVKYPYRDCSSGSCVNRSYAEVKPLTYRVIKDDCKWPQYCVLAFVDEHETRNDSAITGYTYGRCGMGY